MSVIYWIYWLSASAVVIHYEEALVYAPFTFYFFMLPRPLRYSCQLVTASAATVVWIAWIVCISLLFKVVFYFLLKVVHTINDLSSAAISEKPKLSVCRLQTAHSCTCTVVAMTWRRPSLDFSSASWTLTTGCRLIGWNLTWTRPSCFGLERGAPSLWGMTAFHPCSSERYHRT